MKTGIGIINQIYCKTNESKWLPAGVADLRRKIRKGETDDQLAESYGKKELIALLRYNINRIKDNRGKKHAN